jgi:hypothetical protein
VFLKSSITTPFIYKYCDKADTKRLYSCNMVSIGLYMYCVNLCVSLSILQRLFVLAYMCVCVYGCVWLLSYFVAVYKLCSPIWCWSWYQFPVHRRTSVDMTGSVMNQLSDSLDTTHCTLARGGRLFISPME